MLPPNLRSLSIVRDGDGYQASLNTTDMAHNTFRVRHGATPTAALNELLRKPVPDVLPPVPV